MGKKQGLETLSGAARAIGDDGEVTFVFCGEGAGREELVAGCEGLENVRFLPLQPLERLGDLLGLADVHLLPQRADAEELVMPSKLTGMLASGRAIVATAREDSELAEVVGQCGSVVAPGDSDALAAAITELAAAPQRRESLGLRARAIAEKSLAKDKILRSFMKSARELVDQEKSQPH